MRSGILGKLLSGLTKQKKTFSRTDAEAKGEESGNSEGSEEKHSDQEEEQYSHQEEEQYSHQEEEENGSVVIIAGLGNPGKKYEHTRHNCGFETIDILSDRYRIPVMQAKFKGICGSGMIDGVKTVLVKPMTYMNLSGECLRQVCDFYKADPQKQLIVLCDDVSLPPGSLRIRLKGSAGGHNGLKNIIEQLGTQSFARVRIGVGEKPEGYDLADYVLGHFAGQEALTMADAFDTAARAAAELVTQDPQKVMSKYNGK